MKALEIANECALNYRNSRNPRLLVELCLMQLASLNDLEQKKKPFSQPYIIPASKLKAPTPKPAKEDIDPPALVNPPEPAIVEPSSLAFTKPPQAGIPEPDRRRPEKPDKSRKIELNIEGGRSGVSSLSLKSIQEKRDIKAQQKASGPAPGVKRTKEFTVEEFLSAWNQYTSQIKEQGKFNLYSHLTMEVPLLEGTDILLTYPNDTIRLEVEREQGALLTHLANALENDHLKIIISVVESAVKRYAYTPEEKYAQLSEQNPLLDVLRSSLDLDV